ncbi:Serine/threonine-protein kinase PrkC [Posidoniimonas polymericola]|uniref:non-specific serine/threonine protein kinase n=1 Tax=Posidoniimonas polymericola TaxID=2528002 RepID=A0A5C5XZI7_9BACT|nr:serine/threonine-protein kinase [Posidoniimonas polymericola]TWT67703.1 Serine/threonine-protein kinase PrkC [Posidoniimonas polymericola]
MPELTANKLVELIRKSGLIKEDRLDDFLNELAEASGGALPEDNQAIVDRLIEAGMLTKWQSDKLLAGKHKGFRLGKYKLLGQIGKGGMSSVYLAEHVMMKRRVAIKVLPRSRVKDKSYLERFQLEARAVARLDDPNIVRAYDIDSEENVHYIVMEYVDGKDLHQIVAENGPLDFITAADYLVQAANGLQHAHEMGLVHRDIKPANLLVDQHETVKLLDLGLAKMANDDEASLTLAHEENVLGTADYLAPEQALNSHTADERADIYSLGCTLYYLLTGRPPFPDGTISERLLKHQVETPEPIIKFRPDAPLSLLEICARMMMKKADERYQSAGEVAAAMTAWLSERGRKPGGARKNESSDDSGVGSGILSRFSVKPPSGGPGISPKSSGGLSSPMRDTTKLNGPDTAPVSEEDLELAPLDEEAEGPRPKPKPAAPSSGVLSDDSSATGSSSRKASSASAKKRSIFEEEFEEKEREAAELAKAQARREYNPLHPPGYKNPYNRTNWVAWLLGGLAVAILIAIVLVIANSTGS